MATVAFSVETVARALGDAAVASVEVVETFGASCTEVARLRVRFSDRRAPVTVVGKAATGAGLAANRRELRFFAQIAPLWDNPAPRFLGAWEDGDGDATRLLLLTEDLVAAGYALLHDGVSQAQLHGVTDTLVRQHARFWNDLQSAILDPGRPAVSVTRSAQAWPADVVAAHAIAARAEAVRFLAARSAELAPADGALLEQVMEAWESRFLARIAGGRSLTLIHADFHLFGNVFFGADASRPRVIDWSELKPGLGPYDLAYCVYAAATEDRRTRDLALLRRYWEGLGSAGVEGYRWDLCQWDYQFAIVTNLLQAVFQDSVTWFRNNAAAIADTDALVALRSLPPVS